MKGFRELWLTSKINPQAFLFKTNKHPFFISSPQHLINTKIQIGFIFHKILLILKNQH